MSQKPKKIVSKREYTKAIGKRLILITLSLALFLVALGDKNGYFVLSYMYSVYPQNPYLKIIENSGSFGEFCVFFCNVLIALGLGWAGIRTLKKARQIDPGLPRTRANIDHLPAAESLVRASEPPVLSQQSVLLRPATHTQDRHEDQLLRPS
jgi:hypothetical protein